MPDSAKLGFKDSLTEGNTLGNYDGSVLELTIGTIASVEDRLLCGADDVSLDGEVLRCTDVEKMGVKDGFIEGIALENDDMLVLVLSLSTI